MKVVRFCLALMIVGTFVGCGVKGDPLPPDRPAEIGRGRPMFKRATEKIPIQKANEKDLEDRDEDEKEDEGL